MDSGSYRIGVFLIPYSLRHHSLHKWQEDLIVSVASNDAFSSQSSSSCLSLYLPSDALLNFIYHCWKNHPLSMLHPHSSRHYSY